MNKVILIGRLTSDPEIRHTNSEIAVSTFSIAIDRGEAADFPQIVAWRNTAEFLSKYFSKGDRIAIEGQIRTRSYEDANGAKKYVTEVYAEKIEFADGKKQVMS